MGTFEDNMEGSVSRMPSTRVFQKELHATSAEKEISYTPPKFVTKTLLEHGITYDPRKHTVYTAPGSMKFFLETKGNAALVPFETHKESKTTLEDQLKPIMENLNQPQQPPESIPNLEELAKQWEDAVKKETASMPEAAKIFGDSLRQESSPLPTQPLTAETASVLPETQPAHSPESRLAEAERTLSPEQKKTYATLTAWWNSLPETWKPIITHTLIKGTHPTPSPRPAPEAIPEVREAAQLGTPNEQRADLSASPDETTVQGTIEAFKVAKMNLALDFIEKKYADFDTLPLHYQQASQLMARHAQNSVV